MEMSKSYCPSCKKEMRKWISYSDKVCYSMCVNTLCQDTGIVHKDIVNIKNFNFTTNIKI